MDIGHWVLCEGLEGTDELPYGFIYEITNITNSRKYIGKKQCQSVRKRPPLKGKKNKRHELYTMAKYFYKVPSSYYK